MLVKRYRYTHRDGRTERRSKEREREREERVGVERGAALSDPRAPQ